MRLALILACALLASVSTVYAQSSSRSSESDTLSNSSFARVSLRYKSDYYYMGRADSARVPYLVPSLTYYHKSGFFISSSLSYLTAQDQGRVDLFTLGAGYDYFGKKIAVGVSLDEYFFNDLSYAVQAEMRTYLSGYVGYDLNVFLVIVDASLGISENTDVFLGTEISHAFYLLRDRLSVTPAFYSNFGTQQYYNEYYTQRSTTTGSGKKGQGMGSSGTPTTTTISSIEESEKFQVLDYETSLQIGYKIGQLRMIATMVVLFPVNPSTVVTETDTYKEDLNTGSYWSLGVRYTIR